MRAKPAVVNGDPLSFTNMDGESGLSRFNRRRARSSSPRRKMGTRSAVLDPPDVKDGGAEFDLIPAQVAQFGCRIERCSRPTALATSDE
jgi:hypothetical protein